MPDPHRPSALSSPCGLGPQPPTESQGGDQVQTGVDKEDPPGPTAPLGSEPSPGAILCLTLEPPRASQDTEPPGGSGTASLSVDELGGPQRPPGHQGQTPSLTPETPPNSPLPGLSRRTPHLAICNPEGGTDPLKRQRKSSIPSSIPLPTETEHTQPHGIRRERGLGCETINRRPDYYTRPLKVEALATSFPHAGRSVGQRAPLLGSTLPPTPCA